MNNADTVREEHEWEHRRTPEGYLVAQCVKCDYWLWETFHGIPPCVPAR